MQAINHSYVDADNNYWGYYIPLISVDGTSEISAENPLENDPNPGSSCQGLGKIAVTKNTYDNIFVEDKNTSNIYHLAHSAGQNKDYKTAKDLLKSIIDGKFDNKYSPLSLLDFYSFTTQEAKAQDLSNKSLAPVIEYNDLLKEIYNRSLSDSLRPFAVRLLARQAALSNNFIDMLKYNIETVKNYPNSSNELAALYDLVGYYSELDSNYTEANKYLTRMKEVYPDEDLTLFAQLNMGEDVDIYNRPNKNKNSELEKIVEEYLSDAYPNPFNPVTTITYSLKEKDHVTLIVYNVLGKEVANLVDNVQPEGEHRVTFNASNLPSGIYVYKLKGRNFSISKKMLLLK